MKIMQYVLQALPILILLGIGLAFKHIESHQKKAMIKSFKKNDKVLLNNLIICTIISITDQGFLVTSGKQEWEISPESIKEKL